MIVIKEVRKMDGETKLSGWITLERTVNDHRDFELTRKAIAEELGCPNVDMRWEEVPSYIE